MKRISRLVKFKLLIFFVALLALYILLFTPEEFQKNKDDLLIVNPLFDPPIATNDVLAYNKNNHGGEHCGNSSGNLHLYYVKIHKTGSSTFQNILYRYGMKNNLAFALFGCMYGMSYPHPPKEEYLFKNPTSSNPRFSGKYDLLTDHSQYCPDAYGSYMASDTKVVTLLRHPLKQLKSTFGFWGLPAKFGITAADAVEEYIMNPEKYEQKRDSFGCFPKIQISQTKNPQSHHLGLKNQDNPTEEEIENLRQLIQEKFSLVMILERFEESLLLFKRMFCLSFQDIVHLNLFSTKSFHRKTYDSEKDSNENEIIEKHRQWSAADYKLYDYFSQKLNDQIDELGSSLQQELENFREVKDKVRDFCTESCDVFQSLKHKEVQEVRNVLNSEILTFPESQWSPEFSISRGDCALMMFETLIYDEAIKAKQWPTACPGFESQEGQEFQKDSKKSPNINVKYCNTSDYFVANFPWEALKNTQYFTKGGCLGNL